MWNYAGWLKEKNSSPSPMHTHTFSPSQMEQLVMSEEGLAPSTALLHEVSSLERKIKYRDAEEFLKTLVRDKWLEEVVYSAFLSEITFLFSSLCIRFCWC